MKLLAVVLLITSLCGIFVAPVNGLSCYECSWKDASCNSEQLATNVKQVTCGTTADESSKNSSTDSPAGSVTDPVADATTPAADSPPSAEKSVAGFLKFQATDNSKTNGKSDVYYCFQVLVKANGTGPVTVERGCKKTDATDDCLKPALDKATYPNGTVEMCTTCQKDNCNVGISLNSNALLIQCALLSATMIAKMFFQRKL